MNLAPRPVAPLPDSIVKMEERKRPATQSADDIAPPSKKQHVNGGRKASADADLPWKEDLEEFQKDAILRQMKEYKREKAMLESSLKDVQKRAADHDDHLRIIDAWWLQLLDEVRLLSGKTPPTNGSRDSSFPTALDFKSCSEFSEHLAAKAKQIKSSVSEIFANIMSPDGVPPDDVNEMQASLNRLLAVQKEHMVKIDRLTKENEQCQEDLQASTLRYFQIQRKFDRSKSSAVAKLEQQAIAGTGNSAGSGIGSVENGTNNGVNGVQPDDAQSEATMIAYKAASATTAKQKEQLDAIMTENKSLTDQLSAANVRLSSLTDDDYAKTELFKQFRAQHEEVIKRINNLESTNIQLREEAERFQAERTAFRNQIENEAELVSGDLESQLQRAEADLTRIRATRDELVAELAVRKASQDQEKSAADQLKELIVAKDDRIVSLESQVERLESQIRNQPSEASVEAEIESLGIEELRTRYKTLEETYESVSKELPGMEKAYRRSMALASKKVMDFAALEERVASLTTEKAKADQKYFSVRKDFDSKYNEARQLRAEKAKSSEVISQLKDTEASHRTLMANLDKQLSELRQANGALSNEHRKLESQSTEATSKLETMKSQVNELANIVKLKDSASHLAKQRLHLLETELEDFRVRLERSQKERDTYKAKSQADLSKESEAMRLIIMCTVCRNNAKNIAIKTCGHLFCNQCIDDRLSNRMRKCPACMRSFDKMDLMTVHFNH